MVKAYAGSILKSVNIQIKTKGIELTDAIEGYVQKKFASLNKFLKNAPEDLYCLVEVGKSTKHHKNGDVFMSDAKIGYGGKTLYASSQKTDLYAAIDDLKDELARELTKIKEKKVLGMRKNRIAAKNMIRALE